MVSAIIHVKEPNYFCSICYKGFTRRENGKRHNDNLHDSNAPLHKPKELSFHATGTGRSKKVGFGSRASGLSKDEHLYQTLDRIRKEFEDCEHELELTLARPEDKAMYLAPIVIHSLTSENPREPMKRHLKALRSDRLRVKIILCIAEGFHITPLAAKELLIGILE